MQDNAASEDEIEKKILAILDDFEISINEIESEFRAEVRSIFDVENSESV
jgi:hypothetical protein